MKTKAKPKARLAVLVPGDLKRRVGREASDRGVWPARIVEEALRAHFRNSAPRSEAASSAG